ncbi:CHASE domain-containing protein [Pseudomonas sp. S5(2021)]|nr:CHASE domain-containing protein [Pseudomonas sp. S5(2021)]
MEDRPAFHSRKPWLPLLVTLALMAGLGGWIGWQWHAQESRTRIEQEQRFTFAVDDIEQTLRARMRAYEMVLRGMAGLYAGSAELSADEWGRASDQLQLQDFYPGIQAVALARYATRETIVPLVESIRAGGRPLFRIYPQGLRDEYLFVEHIHPTDWRNRRVMGFDMFSEATRREAIVAARDSGNPVLTGPLRLKQETEQDVQSGVLLYFPLYRPNSPITTVEERRRAFFGTMHGAFRLTDLMEGILGSRSDSLLLQLFDAGNPEVPLLAGRGGIDPNARFQRTRNIYMYGRSWQLKVASTRQYEAAAQRSSLGFNLLPTLAAAMLFSLLVGGYLYLRERALRQSEAASLLAREREARFRQLIEQLPVATLLCNASGRIELANQSAANLLGSSTSLLAGERASRYLPELTSSDSASLRVTATQQETQAIREDGNPIPVALSQTSFKQDDALFYVVNLVDLQARKRDEERFRNVVEASPNAFVLVDSHGIIVMVNRQTELLFGYNRQELLGQALEILLPEATREAHRGLRQAFSEHPEPRRMGSNRELFGRHRDGSLLPVEIGLSPLRSGDEVLVQAVIIDISHRKAAERRLRDQADQLAVANRYKSEFLANMSHELRTPLNSILILSDQLRQNAQGNLSEKQVRHADIMHRAGHDLLQMINDVLDLARIESGHMQLSLEPVDLRQLLDEAQAALGPMAAQKGLTLTTTLEPGAPISLDSDRIRLQQILRNLLTNALKFTERGRVEVKIRCKEGAAAHECAVLQIVVCDTGIGIPAEEQERIFQAFQQIDGSISRQYGGTGLGLAITRQLVEVLGGRIGVESEPGKGSCFSVEFGLPRHTPSASRPERAPLISRQEGAAPGVLIIEDDADFASVVAEVAHTHGFAPLVCADGEQGIEALRHGRFAAVILDILLPDVSGWEIYRQLRNDERHQRMPVVIISCVPQPGEWHDDLGRYLMKPVSQASLERLFIELGRRESNPLRLLLVEADPRRRAQLRDYLERLGYSVSVTGTSEAARLAFAERAYGVLVVDYELPDAQGSDLLDALDRLRPLKEVRVVVLSETAPDAAQLSRLQRYPVTLLSRADELQALGEALNVHGHSQFMPAERSVALGQRVLLVDEDVRLLYSLTGDLDTLGLQVEAVTGPGEALQRFDDGAFDLVMIDMSRAESEAAELPRRLKEEHACQVPVIALLAQPDEAARALAGGADAWLAKPVTHEALLSVLEQSLGLRRPGIDEEE